MFSNLRQIVVFENILSVHQHRWNIFDGGRRWIRYRPYKKPIFPDEHADDNFVGSRVGRSQNRYTKSEERVKNLLDNSATFEDMSRSRSNPRSDPPGQESGSAPVDDPFLSTPYTRGTRVPFKRFSGGDSAIAEMRRRKIDPDSTSVIFFPGQGTQFVGMCGDVKTMPKEESILYEVASEILGYDLLNLCANGPKEKLNQTVYCQPAVFVSSLAALEKLRRIEPEAIENCVSTAGFSIGEVTALVFSGILSFEDAVRFVKVRAEAMQLASEMVPSAMATVLFGADSKLEYGLLVAKEWCKREYNMENPVCSVANYLFPHCKVIAGHLKAIEFIEANYGEFKLRKVKRLPVSGAFHTDLMKPAAEAVHLILEQLTINEPRIPVFSDVTGHRYHSSKDVIKQLPKQIYRPVMWEQILHNLYQRPKETEYPRSFECGPGSSLSSVLKLVNAKASLKCTSICP